MNSTEDSDWPYSSEGTSRNLSGRLAWRGNFLAVVFNTGFAILAVVTLCGIVFITRPKVVMHDIPPQMWLPLLIVMAPCQIYAQFLSWATVLSGQNPIRRSWSDCVRYVAMRQGFSQICQFRMACAEHYKTLELFEFLHR